MELLFLFFGFFIAMLFFSPGATDPWAGVRPWSAVWYLVTMFAALLFGGWVAARLAVNRGQGTGPMHGITTWGLASLAGLVIALMVAGSALNQTFAVLRTGVLAAANTMQPGQVVNQAQQAATNVAQAAPGTLRVIFLFAWLGSIVSLIGAWIGGKAGEHVPLFRRGVEVEPGAPRERRAA